MTSLFDLHRCGLLLLLVLPLSAAAADSHGEIALDEAFLLFLDEWADESGEVVGPGDLESIQEAPPSGDESEKGEGSRPQEEENA